MTRREMLRMTALTGAGLFAARGSVWTEPQSPNDKLNHACIGVGGMMGGADYKSLSRHPRVRIAALCDVDTQFLARVAKEQPEARCYTDWRELFDREGDRIDSVNVSVLGRSTLTLHESVPAASMLIAPSVSRLL